MTKKKAADPNHAQQQLERRVEEVLRSMDPEQTKDYHRALEVIPDLVKRESNVADFLAIENQDPQKAAERLGRYWSVRKATFGPRS